MSVRKGPSKRPNISNDKKEVVDDEEKLEKSSWDRFLKLIGLRKTPPPVVAEAHEPQLEILPDPMLILGIKFKAEWVVDTETHLYYYWQALISLIVLYNVITVAMRATFFELNGAHITGIFMALDYTGDVIFFLDLFVRMFTGYLSEDGLTVTEPRKLMQHWWSHLDGKLDLLCILPTDLLFCWSGVRAPYVFVRINRYLKFVRFQDFTRRTENRVAEADIFRLFVVLFQFLIVIHLNACLYYFLCEKAGLNSSGWAYPGLADWRDDVKGNAHDTLQQKYTWSFYWSFHTLTMIGIIVQPEEPWEFLFLTVNYLVAVMLFSQILGNVSRTVLNASANSRHFRHKMDAVMNYVNTRNISESLKDRLIAYFEYQWVNRRYIDDKQALEGIPERIEAEIAMKVHLDTLKRVRIFQGVEPGLLADLVLKLKLQVYPPGDYVCRKGDIGKELYIVKTGCLEVVSDDGDVVFARLGGGSVFGEISILNIAGIKSGNRRTANVRSLGYSDLFTLSKHDLWEALREYPDGKKKMLELGRTLLIKDNLLDVQKADEADQKHSHFLNDLERVEGRIDSMQTRMGRLIVERDVAVDRIKRRMAKVQHALQTEAQNEAEWSIQEQEADQLTC